MRLFQNRTGADFREWSRPDGPTERRPAPRRCEKNYIFGAAASCRETTRKQACALQTRALGVPSAHFWEIAEADFMRAGSEQAGIISGTMSIRAQPVDVRVEAASFWPADRSLAIVW